LGGETGDSVMLFEETAPSGTETTYHLHHDSDEVAYVLAGEITFKIGEEVTVGGPGTCAFMPRGLAHAWKNLGAETARVLSFILRRSGRVLRGVAAAAALLRVVCFRRRERRVSPPSLGDRRAAFVLTTLDLLLRRIEHQATHLVYSISLVSPVATYTPPGIDGKLITMKQPVVCCSLEVMGGTAVFYGTRVPVQTLLDYIEAGDTIDDFLEGFPSVTREQVIAFLEEAKDRLIETVS
jgi:uncharacterized protein (DUF433 family)/quercetin dioxygenase-like cupin family protein